MKLRCDFCSRAENEEKMTVIWDGYMSIQKRLCSKCVKRYQEYYEGTMRKRE